MSKHTFAFIDLTSSYFLINFLTCSIVIFSIVLKYRVFGFFSQVMLYIKNQSIEVQQLIVELQRLLFCFGLTSLIFANYFIYIINQLNALDTDNHCYRFTMLLKFYHQGTVELAKKGQFDLNDELAVKALENNHLITQITQHLDKPHNLIQFVFVLGIIAISVTLLEQSGFLSKFNLNLLLVAQLDQTRPVLFFFYFFGAVTIISFVFRTFFIERFLLFFKNLNEQQKIKFLKKLRLLLIGSFTFNVVLLVVFVWTVFYIQSIGLIQVHHLYEIQQSLYNEMQTILVKLLEKQKLYLTDTVEYQNVTSLINFTDIVIKYQELILDIFERKYSLSADQSNTFSSRYVVVVRKLISGLFGLGFLVLVYKAYQSSNIKK